jgi:hypothetical protein
MIIGFASAPSLESAFGYALIRAIDRIPSIVGSGISPKAMMSSRVGEK